MRSSYFRPLSMLLLVSAAFVACVPARKYEESETRVRTMQGEVDAANARARDAQAAFEEIKARDAENTKRVEELRRDTTVLGTSLRQMTVQYDKINDLNNELLDKYNKLLAGDRSENRKLLTDLESLRLDLMNKEDSVNALARRVNEKESALAEREAALTELRAELASKDAAMRALKDRVSTALTGFEGKGLTVEQRNGRIYVSMDNKLLFPSGSYAVDAKGKELIAKLAKAIENEADLNVLVEGHTDTDKVQPGGTLKDNWDLSVLRATSVVRLIQETSRMDPVRVTAAGRGEHVPVDPADKARNRRIEIILAPDLKELYNLVKE
ncbi:MAG: OmpA family protein [Flavobacteriales bacterium]|jgi:chemotaxis protein MotB|nr:OmpA family protein [Flavobacteriales bacterium]